MVWRPRTSRPPDSIIFQRARRVGRVVRYPFLSILKQLGLRPFSNKLAAASSTSKPCTGVWPRPSLIVGLLLTQLGPGDPRLVKVPRASPEMGQILRDEHRLIANIVELQIASEKMLAYGDATSDQIVEARWSALSFLNSIEIIDDRQNSYPDRSLRIVIGTISESLLSLNLLDGVSVSPDRHVARAVT